MEIQHVLLIAVAIMIAFEIYIKAAIVDSTGKSEWPDDEPKGMAKQYAKLANESNASKRRYIRTAYIVGIVVIAILAFAKGM